MSIEGLPASPPGFLSPAQTTVEGVVLASPPGTVIVDTCPPGESCFASTATLTASAPNLPEQLVPVNALVRLHYATMLTNSFDSRGGSVSHVLVQNLPQWGGMTNPVSQSNRVWFAAHEAYWGIGFSAVGDPDPYEVTVATQCLYGQLYFRVDTYELTFPGSSVVEIPQGEARTLNINGDLAGTYVFQSLSNNYDIDGHVSASYWLMGY